MDYEKNPQISKNMIYFLDDCQKRGLQEATIRNYASHLRSFFELGHIHSIEDITSRAIDTFRSRLELQRNHHDQPLSDRTINYYLIAIRMFLLFLEKHHPNNMRRRDIRLKKIAPASRPILDRRAISQFVSMPLRSDDLPLIKMRDYLLLSILAQTGLKVSRLRQLRFDDIDTGRKQLILKDRDARLTFDLDHQLITHFKKFQAMTADGFLFRRYDRAAGESGKPLSSRSIERLLEKYSRAAGLPFVINPETLRHAHAQHLRDAGDSDEVIRKNLLVRSKNIISRLNK